MRDGEYGVSVGIKVPLEAGLREKPWHYDWFNVMRWLEAHNPSYPRFGTAVRPADEIVRISQKPSLSFAPATLSSFGGDSHGRVWIEQVSFGLYGPGGPMPLHFTEYAYERSKYDDDQVLRSFLDIFHHRFSLMFYRAWASVQATNSLDRPDEDRFGRYVGSLSGYGEAVFDDRDTIPDHAKAYMTGHLARLTRNPEGLTSILQDFFGCPFRIQEWMPHWLHLDERECTALGAETAASQLGQGAICGITVLDRQHRFRIHVGPLKWSEYQAFLPQRKRFLQLRDWVRNYIGYEFSWDVRLVLRRDEVSALRLGVTTDMLGWSSWMGCPRTSEDRGDLVLEGERPEMPSPSLSVSPFKIEN
jgi:type VI secretion system protein ImpH